MIETKENLLEYYGLLHPDETVQDMSYEELFYKTHGITYNHYLRESEELEEKVNQLNYEQIPQRKMILKKNNIKNIKDSFNLTLNKFQTVVQSKKSKRIMILNFFVDNIDVYCLVNEYGVKIKRDENNNVLVSFSLKVPTHFEIDYFSVKQKTENYITQIVETENLPKLKLVTEIEDSSKRLSKNIYELTNKARQNLNS